MAQSSPARPGPNADDRRRQILDAVLGCLGEGGFDALSMRAVAERAGVPLGSLHYYFASKEEMVGAALARSVEDLIAGVVSSVDAGLPPRGRLAALLRGVLPGLCADPAVPVYIGFWTWCRQEPQRRALYSQVSRRIHESVLRLVRDGVATGDFHVADAEAAATLVVSAMLGYILDHHGDPGGVDEALLGRVADTVETALAGR